VDFELSDDQVALRDAAASLLDGRCSMARVREVAAGLRHLDDELWTAMADQGWPAVERPTDDGGLGLGLVEVAVLCEELGRHVAPVPFAGTVLAHGALVEAGALEAGAGKALTPDVPLGDAPAGQWAERLASGEAMGAVAWSQRPDAVRCEAGPDGLRLVGRADPVVYGPEADVVIVIAAGPDTAAPHVFAVVGRGVGGDPEPAMDITRSLSWMAFDHRPAVMIGGTAQAELLLDRAATAVSAEMLGAADHVLAMTVQYAKDRIQFGRPIGSFQAVKHRCADMLVDVEGMRSAAYYAAWAVGAGDPDSRAAASAAKVWCSEAARRVMASALQVHGGIGFTWEHDLHLFLKRSQLDQVSFGGATHHRERIAAILRPRAEAGQPVL
jgi:alkylation response protein AidB-like acyl-CoA dehydrogenase